MAAVSWKEQRDALHKCIQREAMPSDRELARDAGASGAVLTNWVIVAEFVDVQGERWLARRDSEDLTLWGRQGMLHNALLSDEWHPDEEDDD